MRGVGLHGEGPAIRHLRETRRYAAALPPRPAQRHDLHAVAAIARLDERQSHGGDRKSASAIKTSGEALKTAEKTAALVGVSRATVERVRLSRLGRLRGSRRLRRLRPGYHGDPDEWRPTGRNLAESCSFRRTRTPGRTRRTRFPISPRRQERERQGKRCRVSLSRSYPAEQRKRTARHPRLTPRCAVSLRTAVYAPLTSPRIVLIL